MVRRTVSLLVIVTLTMGVVGVASRDSVPGELLYPVKRALEFVYVALTPRAARTAQHTVLATNRIEELWEVFGRGEASPETIDALTFDMLAQTDLALNYIGDAPEALRQQLLRRLLDRIGVQQTLLAALTQNASEMERAGLERALGALQLHRGIAEALLGIAQAAAGGGQPAPTPGPTATSAATHHAAPDPVRGTATQGEPQAATDRPAATIVARSAPTQRRALLTTPTPTVRAPTLPPALPSPTPSAFQPPAPTLSPTPTQAPAPANPPGQPAPPATVTAVPSAVLPPASSTAQPTAAGTATPTTTAVPIILTLPPQPTQPPAATTTPSHTPFPPPPTLTPTTPAIATATPCPTNPGGQPKCEHRP